MSTKQQQTFIAKHASHGFQGRYWEKGQEVVVSPEEMAEQKKLGLGQKDEVKDGKTTVKDKSALKHFRRAGGEDEHGEVTMTEAANSVPETATRLMGITDPDHPDENVRIPTTADSKTAEELLPGRSAPSEDAEEKPRGRSPNKH